MVMNFMSAVAEIINNNNITIYYIIYYLTDGKTMFLKKYFVSALSNMYITKKTTEVGYEPTPPKWLVPKTSALEHSSILPYNILGIFDLYLKTHTCKNNIKNNSMFKQEIINQDQVIQSFQNY